MDDLVKVEKESCEMEDLQNVLEKTANPEEKLKKTIELMEICLEQQSSPDFKTFWNSRKACLPLFKENLSQGVRTVLWEKYRELTRQARQLKDVLEEETTFAVEQIDKAIEALEQDVNHFDEILKKYPMPDFPNCSNVLNENLSQYQKNQKELNLLNTYAVRINTLRKELIRTEMRIRLKNQFFQRLSTAGDQVFPRRKNLIGEISQLFIEDVRRFVEKGETNPVGKVLFQIREDVKILQSMAKILTLNSKAFTQSRKKLSECWNFIKEQEKKKKKENLEKKEVFEKNAETILEKITGLKDKLETLSVEVGMKELKEIQQSMRMIELGRDQVRSLKQELEKVEKPLKDRAEEEEKQRQLRAREKEKQRQEEIEEVNRQITSLGQKADSIDTSSFSSILEEIQKKIKALSLTNFEKNQMRSKLNPLHDLLAKKQEEMLLELSDDQKVAKEQLEKVLHSRLGRRIEIKENIKKFGKICGSSGLDFAQSLQIDKQLQEEKVRLESLDKEIEEVEQQLKKFRG